MRDTLLHPQHPIKARNEVPGLNQDPIACIFQLPRHPLRPGSIILRVGNEEVPRAVLIARSAPRRRRGTFAGSTRILDFGYFSSSIRGDLLGFANVHRIGPQPENNRLTLRAATSGRGRLQVPGIILIDFKSTHILNDTPRDRPKESNGATTVPMVQDCQIPRRHTLIPDLPLTAIVEASIVIPTVEITVKFTPGRVSENENIIALSRRAYARLPTSTILFMNFPPNGIDACPSLPRRSTASSKLGRLCQQGPQRRGKPRAVLDVLQKSEHGLRKTEFWVFRIQPSTRLRDARRDRGRRANLPEGRMPQADNRGLRLVQPTADAAHLYPCSDETVTDPRPSSKPSAGLHPPNRPQQRHQMVRRHSPAPVRRWPQPSQ